MTSDPVETLTVNGAPTLEHIDVAALDSYQFPDGAGFPPSFRRFVRHAGWARTFGLWLIYPPVLDGYADGLQSRARDLTEQVRASYADGHSEDFDWMIEPDGTWELPASLEVFGWSENGDALLWDTGSRTGDGEFAIWESRSVDSLFRLGDSLSEAIPALRERAAALFGTAAYDVEPLPSVRLTSG